MNVIYDIAEIRISEVHTQQVEVPRWEIPVLQVIHGNDVKVVGQKIVKRAIPEPADEFSRLASRYGPKNEDTPAVAAVYGNFGPGTQALRREIRDSLTSADATPSDYKSPDERKLIAEKQSSGSGQSIVEEAMARERAQAVEKGLLDSAALQVADEGPSDLPVAPLPIPEIAARKDETAKPAQEAILPDTVVNVQSEAEKTIDADIASLI